MGMGTERDTALVLSGGSINGVLMELGFLRRIRESPLWPRVGWIFGTSAGALAGSLAALDRLDDLERFLLSLQPEDVFRPNRLWRLLLLGSHEYSLPETIAERIGPPEGLAAELTASEIELVVCATDLTDTEEPERNGHAFELVYSSRSHTSEELSQAILASAAMSGLVMPMRIGDRVATDGGWTRNFPLGYAYDRPEVERIVAFRVVPRYPRIDVATLAVVRRRLERFARVPPIRALVEELREAEARSRRGEPAHAIDTLIRLMRVAVVHNTELEERLAGEKDDSIRELARLREDMRALVHAGVRGRRERDELLRAIDERFESSRFPFRRSRMVPRITVRGSVGEVSLEAGRRASRHWSEEDKRALVDRGYELTERELARNEVQAEEAAFR
jgi:predicted acylesterase/phospholipase RssA